MCQYVGVRISRAPIQKRENTYISNNAYIRRMKDISKHRIWYRNAKYHVMARSIRSVIGRKILSETLTTLIWSCQHGIIYVKDRLSSGTIKFI